MLDYPLALEQLLAEALTRRTAVAERSLIDSRGHYLAQAISAQHDMPQFDNSAMDGYALCLHDSEEQLSYHLIGRIAAGDSAEPIQLQLGQAARIFTGAPIPHGCNAVIPQENTQTAGDELICLKAPKINDNIRRCGEDFALGTEILSQGHLLTPAAIGLAAGQGYTALPVHRPLRVTVFSSGNELLEPSQTLHSGAIYDANRYQLITWLTALHCEVRDGGILPDDLARTAEQLQQASSNSDLIITSGGASVGEEDHLKAAITRIGTLTQWKLAIKPGKPFAWGEIGHARVMMLPGNPVATFVTFKMLVEPSLRVMMGAHPNQALTEPIMARANFSAKKADGRREFLRGILWHDAQGAAHVDRMSNQGSHMLSACAQANCLIEVAAGVLVEQGQLLPVHII